MKFDDPRKITTAPSLLLLTYVNNTQPLSCLYPGHQETGKCAQSRDRDVEPMDGIGNGRQKISTCAEGKDTRHFYISWLLRNHTTD